MPKFVPAYLGGTSALSTQAVVGTPEVARNDTTTSSSQEMRNSRTMKYECPS